ncbi:MAG: biotin--[acetyl-CoA-carboxylase] ligase [Anaerolineae bacterium]
MLQEAVPTQDWQYPPWLTDAAGRLKLLKIGGNLIYRRVTSSTNDDVRLLARQGAPDGLVVVADEQTHGRGRLGRAWFAPPESCLLLTVLLRCAIPLPRAAQLTMLMGLATLEALEQTVGVRAELKWPNDVMLDGRKLAGILSECDSDCERVRWAAVGLGLNVNCDFSEQPDLASQATSLRTHLGREVERGPLLAALLRSLSIRYSRMLAGADPVSEWESRLGTLGRPVTVSSGLETFAGLAEFITPEGSLFVKLDDGSRREVFAGDVKLRETVM